MNIDDCFELGHITKTSGYKGELTAFFDVDEPEIYNGLDMVFIELKEGLIPFMILDTNYRGNKKYRLRLEGIESIEDAETLVKKRLFLPLVALPELEEGQFYYHEIIGWKLEDENFGLVGTIVGVNEHHANPLFIVQKDKKELLLPMKDEFLGEVDRKNQTIHYKAPDGLIEVFLGADDQEADDAE